MQSEEAIGVFDSGVGGLSVLAHIRDCLPHERLFYVADSAFMPYGCKSNQLVEERCLSVAAFFAEKKCKAMVVACNTATAAAVHHLRAMYDIPVIGMEPALKPAVGFSRAGVVGILATSGTVGSEKFRRLKDRYALDATLIVQPCPGLVEQIEKGDLDSEMTRSMLGSFLQPLMLQGVDTLVLGCTHYPFVAPLIREIVGETIAIVDTGDAIAREVERQLQLNNLLRSPLRLTDDRSALVKFGTTGDIDQVEPLMSQLWGKDTSPKQLLF